MLNTIQHLIPGHLSRKYKGTLIEILVVLSVELFTQNINFPVLQHKMFPRAVRDIHMSIINYCPSKKHIISLSIFL